MARTGPDARRARSTDAHAASVARELTRRTHATAADGRAGEPARATRRPSREPRIGGTLRPPTRAELLAVTAPSGRAAHDRRCEGQIWRAEGVSSCAVLRRVARTRGGATQGARRREPARHAGGGLGCAGWNACATLRLAHLTRRWRARPRDEVVHDAVAVIVEAVALLDGRGYIRSGIWGPIRRLGTSVLGVARERIARPAFGRASIWQRGVSSVEKVARWCDVGRRLPVENSHAVAARIALGGHARTARHQPTRQRRPPRPLCRLHRPTVPGRDLPR